MTDITTRHIRHDWPEWVDWNNQKTVKTMCGVRSRPGLCGIPGITQQSAVVQKNGRTVWGWCMHCVRVTFPYYLPPALTAEVTSRAILELHGDARFQLAYQYHKHLQSQLRRAKIDSRPNSVAALEDDIDALRRDYPWLDSPVLDPRTLTARVSS